MRIAENMGLLDETGKFKKSQDLIKHNKESLKNQLEVVGNFSNLTSKYSSLIKKIGGALGLLGTGLTIYDNIDAAEKMVGRQEMLHKEQQIQQ